MITHFFSFQNYTKMFFDDTTGEVEQFSDDGGAYISSKPKYKLQVDIESVKEELMVKTLEARNYGLNQSYKFQSELLYCLR